MMKALLLLLLFFTLSCDQKVSQSQTKTGEDLSLRLDPFYGNWLIQDYFAPLKSSSYTGPLNAAEFGVTEIVFSPDFKDSVLFINQDLEASMEKIEVISEDTIQLSFTDSPFNLIVYDKERGLLEYQIDERYPNYSFYKAPDSIVEKSEASAFRKSLNSFFEGNLYSETGDNRYPESRSKVTLDKNGNTRGILEYTHYEIIVNGDLANIEDADRIELSNEKVKDAYGLKLTGKGFDLYHLKLTTLPDEKPNYKTDKLFKSYTRQ